MSVNIGSTAQEILNEINNKVDKITYEAVATTSTAGLMSAADKVKLNNVLPLASVREDSSGNVVVSNDLKVQGGADFTNDVTMGSLTVDAGLQMNDDVEINYQYGIRWTDDNDSGLVSISRNEDTGKLEVHYANNSLPSGALATIGADQIKGIYLTGENRTIVGAESDVGIIWEGDGKLFKDENAITEITNTHFMTRVPIVAGNNVTFETDTENQVVKINATGGGTSGEIDSSIIDLGEQSTHKDAQQAMVDYVSSTYVSSTSSEYDCYLFKYWCSCYGNACFAIVRKNINQQGISCEGTVYDSGASYRNFHYENGEFTVDGCWHNIASFDEELEGLPTEDKSVTGAINEIYQKIGSSSGGTPTKIEYITDATVDWAKNYVEATASGVDISGVGDLNALVSGDVHIEQSGSGSKLFFDSGGDAHLDADASLTLHKGDDESGISISMDADGTAISHPNSILLNSHKADVSIFGDEVYLCGRNEGANAITIEAANDGRVSITGGDMELYGANLKLGIGGSYGTAGQVLKSDGQYAYWGDVEGSSGGGSPMTPITYADLKALRDSGKLVAGMFYRITDYVCTTVQAETRAMNNRFDIIVQALSNNTLSETAKADYNAEDNYFKIESGGNALVEGSVTKHYDIYEDCDNVEDKTANYKSNDTFVEYGYLENNEGVTVPVLYKNEIDSYADEGADYGDTFYYVGTYEYEGTTYDRWRKIEASGYGWDSTGNIYALTNVIVENNEIISSVKAGGIKYNANLPAWELKYCLDNDTTRFAWADQQYGKGVVYFMKDEHGNECPYDFKNIQFKRMVSLENGYPELDTENGTETWVYTFCGNSYHIDNDEWSELKDGSLESPYGHMSDEGSYTFQGNIIKPYILNIDWNDELPTNCGKAYLNNNVFFGWWEEIGSDSPDNYPYYYMYGCAYNTFGYNCHDNTMGRNCRNNIFGNKCESNTFDHVGNCNFGNDFSGQHITAWDKNYSYKKYEHLIELTSHGTVYLNGIPYKFMLFAHRVKDFSYNSSTISDYFPDGCRIGVTGYVSYNVDSDNESTLIPYFIWRSNNQITIFVNDPNKEIKSLSFSISKFKITSHVYEI